MGTLTPHLPFAKIDIETNPKIVKAAMTFHHSALLSASSKDSSGGRIFVSGKQNMLEAITADNFGKFVPFGDLTKKFIYITAGDYHFLAISGISKIHQVSTN